jgi:hypothetical protein
VIHRVSRRQSERTEINIEFLTDLNEILVLVCGCLGPGVGFEIEAGDGAENRGQVVQSLDGLGEGAKWLEGGDELFQSGEVVGVGGCYYVAEYYDEGDEGGHEDAPVIRM